MDAEFRDNLERMQIAVLGAGASGRAACEAASRYGAAVTVLDDRPLGEVQVAIEDLTCARLAARSFADGAPDPTEFDLIVASPGLAPSHPFVAEGDRQGVPIISEVELGWRLAPCPIIAVTGTNGKSTVAALIGEMLRSAGRTVSVAGNIKAEEIALPLSAAVLRAGADDIIAAEISSFQLERVDRFRPAVAVLTNLGYDHLDRHGTPEGYWATKARIFARQDDRDYAVLPHGGRRCAARAGAASRLWFGFGDPVEDGAYCRDDEIAVRWRGSVKKALSTNEIRIPGRHNLTNVLAAAAACLPFGAEASHIAKGAREFRGLAHRLEDVATVNGVRYVNNSMCTNPEAAAASVTAFGPPVILIAGGKNKNLALSPFSEAAAHVAEAILIGESARDIGAQLESGGVRKIAYAGSMAEAVQSAAAAAQPGDVVLLSPGCASFDMFDDFEHRGREFARAVHALGGVSSRAEASR